MRPQAFATPTTATLLLPNGASLPLPAEWRYDPADPYAVTLTFLESDVQPEISWVFARDLVKGGLNDHTGYGDVSTWPAKHNGHNCVALRLSSPDGLATFMMPRLDVVSHLAESIRLVPLGREGNHTEAALDKELRLILGN